MSDIRIFNGPTPDDAKPSVPYKTVPLSAFRFKGGRLQQLHNDPSGGPKRYWLDVPHVGEDASDVA